jgi:hypothetical protein
VGQSASFGVGAFESSRKAWVEGARPLAVNATFGIAEARMSEEQREAALQRRYVSVGGMADELSAIDDTE